MSSTRTAGVVAALAWAGAAIIGLTNPTFDDQLTTTIDYVNDATFTVALVATAIAALHLLELGAASKPLRMVQVGYLLVAVGVVAGLVLGHSPSWFAAVGVPGNLIALIGMVWVGVHGLVRRSLPRHLAVLAIPTGLLSVLGAEFGTSLIATAFWLLVAGTESRASLREPVRV